MNEELDIQGLVGDLRETCASRWSDTITACDEQRAEAADLIEKLQRALGHCSEALAAAEGQKTQDSGLTGNEEAK